MVPSFPNDFRIVHAEGGVSFFWWSPTHIDWDGLTPVGGTPPSGIMISSSESIQAELISDERVIVMWTDAGEDGPHEFTSPDPIDVSRAIERIIEMWRQNET